MAQESGHLTLVNFDAYVQMFTTLLRYTNSTNPDIYVDNGFNLWGYDSLRIAISNNMPATMETRNLFASSGLSLSRENWRTYAMRKINQFTADETERLESDDAFPMFYDHIPAALATN